MRVVVVMALLLTGCGASTPSEPVRLTCQDIPADTCHNTDWLEMANVDRSRIAEIVVTCQYTCDFSGSAQVVFVLKNGYRTGFHYDWDGMEPRPS